MTEPEGRASALQPAAGGSRWPLTSQMREQSYPLRDFAAEVIEVLDRHAGNMATAFSEVMPAIHRLLDEPTLLDLGVTRQGNHTPGSQWLYYDYELEIHLSTFAVGVPVPIHNHGTWEFIAPYRGDFDYTSYRRVDDGAVEGHAELDVDEHRLLSPGDAAVCGPPPLDIHTFTPLTEGMWLLGMNHGPLAPIRTYYDVSDNSCQTRDSQAWRRSRSDDL
jgi:predicted metal-dependent enzyme (double-stranded beta helix superfamily)